VTGRRRRRWRPHPPGPIDAAREAVLVFDGDCGFCTSAARWLERGFRHGERAEAWQLLGEEGLARLGLTPKDAEQAAWWADREGRRERGHRAAGRALVAAGGWRRGAGRLILTPPTSWLAAGAYRLVVRWRHRLPGGTPACRVEHAGREAGEGSPSGLPGRPPAP
jgi:predicted DCC family thiol-disulfide oxidoreductase YuxK